MPKVLSVERKLEVELSRVGFTVCLDTRYGRRLERSFALVLVDGNFERQS